MFPPILDTNQFLKGFPPKSSPENHGMDSGDLCGADLRNVNLSFANLRGVNLTGANLQEANLSGADLREANLNSINLKGARLRGANLSGAQLSMATLDGADLSGAILLASSLDAATLSQACLRGADLRGAYLVGVDFSNAQLRHSFYSTTTRFQKGFDPAEANMLTEIQITFGQVVSQLNLVGQFAKSYLGTMITARYWENYRVEVEELKNFQVETGSAQIRFLGNTQSNLGFNELQDVQTWTNCFIKQCSQVVRYFPNLLEQNQLNYTLSTL